MYPLMRLIAITAVVLLPLPSVAADSRAVAPFLDDLTLSVIRLDLKALDIDTNIDQFAELFAGPAADTKELKQAPVVRLLGRLKQACAEEAYVVFSLNDLPDRKPFVVVPSDNEHAKDVSNALCGNPDSETPGLLLPNDRPFDECAFLRGAVVAGSRATVARLRELKPVERPDVEAAFGAIGDGQLQVLLVPPPDARRVMRELSPQMPQKGAMFRQVIDPITWAALSVRFPPDEVTVRFVAGTDTEADAQQLANGVSGILSGIAEAPDARKAFAGVEQIFEKLKPRAKGSRVLVTLEGVDIEEFIALAKPQLQQVRLEAATARSTKNLRQIALALHNYHDVQKAFPPRASRGRDGKPLSSWRVHLLPYLEATALYNEFHLDEPWDSEHNRKLISRIPAIYRNPVWTLDASGKTAYVVPVGEGSLFDADEPKSFKDVHDGTSKTIFCIEAAPESAVIWTKPDDWQYAPDQPLKGLITEGQEWFLAAFFDGSVRTIPTTIKPESLRALLTPDAKDDPGEY